ncbi:MAG: ABC transporter permease [Acidobacteria bacterium]|jgi:ABC-2 type transport system permease protein|nr:ABC transporter permease [Acidobacteriota bacterium]
MPSKLWAVVRREYLERVRTKAFIIATVLGPILMGGIIVVPVALMGRGAKLLRVAVVDASGTLQAEVEEALRSARRDERPRFDVQPSGDGTAEARPSALKDAVLRGRLDGYLFLPEDTLDGSLATYYGRTVSNRMDLDLMRWRVNDVVVAHRVARAGLDAEEVKELTQSLELRTVRLSEEGEKEDRGVVGMLFAVILLGILYTSILMWGQVVMTSIIEEKGSRVIEVVASGVTPMFLLAGKLLGVGAAGLTQFLVWSLSLLGVSLAAVGPLAAGLTMPEITPLILASFLAFFLLGFAFYATLYAAIGSAVNTVQEAQNFVFPVIMPLILGFVCFLPVIESPDGALAVTLSLIPFLTPLLMFLRIVVLTPPWWQIALSLVLTGAAIWGALWAAARIYRVGILMYGKKPTFPELVRWVRHA